MSLRLALPALVFPLLVTVGCTGESPPPRSAQGAEATPAAAAADLSNQRAAAGAGQATVLAAAPQVTVYKTPNCGCCTAWVDHLRENGFSVVAHDLDDMTPVRAQHGITREIESCHTAVVDGYVVEGHVPADLIARLLTERPAVAGIAVPGMPIGSPGMEGPFSQRYDVLAFDRDGRSSVYARR